MTFQPASERVTLVCLSGSLDAKSCEELARGVQEHLGQAALRGQRLVLDLSGVWLLSAAARRTLAQATDHLAHTPVLVVGAQPHLRQIVERGNPRGIRLHDHLADVLVLLDKPLPAAAPTQKIQASRAEPAATGGAVQAPEALRLEVFGLRAKARTHALIGLAEGILLTRYNLQRPADAFAVLRKASQQCNVPMRVLASAVITAPVPKPGAELWFPGRATHPPAPITGFLPVHNAKASDRRRL
ncbi:ANTAR domain-containing protein [Streptomyces sp. NPDC055056]